MGKKVLIINDSTLKRKLIRYILSKNGYEAIEESRKGSEAVFVYNNCKPDLVAVDVNVRRCDEGTAVVSLIYSSSGIIMR